LRWKPWVNRHRGVCVVASFGPQAPWWHRK